MSTIKRNDGPTTIPFALKRNGAAVNLTGAAVKAVVARKSNKLLLHEIPCTLTDAAAGEGQFIFTVSHSSQANDLLIEFEVTFADGELRTFPSSGQIEIKIAPDLNP
jgi:hypothetical protein